jgi:hypothetical protein
MGPGYRFPAWRPDFTAAALRMMDASILAWPRDPEREAELAADAGAIFSGGVLLALRDMQAAGTLPAPGTAGWDELVAKAQAGDVEIAVSGPGGEPRWR